MGVGLEIGGVKVFDRAVGVGEPLVNGEENGGQAGCETITEVAVEIVMIGNVLLNVRGVEAGLGDPIFELVQNGSDVLASPLKVILHREGAQAHCEDLVLACG